MFQNVLRAHDRNYQFSTTSQFSGWMTGELVRNSVRVLRVHVAGDFYDVDYTRKWLEIVRHSGRVTFFAYTRSWRDDAILPELIALSELPNFVMWFSLDRETGPAPLVETVRTAYMAIDDMDADVAPDDCDLVFRDIKRRRVPMKYTASGVLVCPAENGVQGKHKHNCSSCGVCWNRSRKPDWRTALLPFMEHDGISIDVPFSDLITEEHSLARAHA